jgi:hypothetical protein
VEGSKHNAILPGLEMGIVRGTLGRGCAEDVLQLLLGFIFNFPQPTLIIVIHCWSPQCAPPLGPLDDVIVRQRVCGWEYRHVRSLRALALWRSELREGHEGF